MTDKGNTQVIKSVVVTGDVTIDNYIYEGQRDASHKRNSIGVRIIKEYGGANLSYKILNELIIKASENKPAAKENTIAQDIFVNPWEIIPGFISSANKDTLCLSSFSLWKPYEINDKKLVWRMSNPLGYGNEIYSSDFSNNSFSEVIKSPKETQPKILVIDDAGYQFRNIAQKTNWELSNDLDWIILKMTGPITSSDLWAELYKNYSHKLTVIISAGDLRAEDFKISKGTSWEQIIEDTRATIFASYNTINLTKCRNLIIAYNNDGVLWLDNSIKNKPIARLICDTSRAENEWSEKISGKAFGYMSCLTSAIVYNLVSHGMNTLDFVNGIKSGLLAMRNLLKSGHGHINKDIPVNKQVLPSGFPFKRIAEEIINPQYNLHKLSNILIPWMTKEESYGKWMIVERLQRSPSIKQEVSLNGLAAQIVLFGTKILDEIPHAKFNNFTTVDRYEIEALRRIRQFMINYRDNTKANKPISFGVFGPPGAGKSFGIKQIAYEVFCKDCWLEFNLSQFTIGSLSELYGAFHQVRDKVLAGIIPIVFMDEFDSKKYEWLQYLLSPMQDGEFQEGQLKHTIGKCIFIFAGATSFTYESFGNFKDTSEGKNDYEDFVLKKGPDFKSRLDTYLNVLGPNQKMLDNETNEPDTSDISYPLRRAIFIASKLKYESFLHAQIDLGLINALLRIPKYKHGARSLDKLITLLISSDGLKLERMNIPSDTQLSVYLDPVEFNRLLSEPQKNMEEIPIEELAAIIHSRWSKSAEDKDKYKVKYEILDEEVKEDNRAAAKRIQEILSVINLKIEKVTESNKLDINQKDLIVDHITHHKELLSAFEHDGWCAVRLKANWEYDEITNKENKRHKLLKPYSDIPVFEQDKDRDSISDYPKLLESFGYQINWIK